MRIPFLLQSKPFRVTILSIFFLEMLSFCAWALPSFGNIAYLILLAVILVLSLEDLRYGVGIALAELLIGSHGYLFSFGTDLSIAIRHGIVLILLTVTVLRSIQEKELRFFQSSLFWPWVVLNSAVLFSIVWGAFLGNQFSNIFFDANAFGFTLLAFPLWQAVKSRADLEFLLQVSVAALIMSVVKVLFLLYAFSHRLWWMLEELYKWVRDTRIAEVTIVTEQFYRVFLQSNIYAIVALLTTSIWTTWLFAQYGFRDFVRTKRFWALFSFLAILFASVLISFSRSNWLGLSVGALSVPFVLLFSQSGWIKKTFLIALTMLASLLFSLVIVTAVVLFPYPQPGGPFDASSLISRRAFTFAGEAGVSSRWQLLPPLWDAVLRHPVLGSGFGTTVTYITEDPRIRAQSPSGEYTTFAFEWGYLDLWLKMGIIGLIAYISLVVVILRGAGKFFLKAKRFGAKAMDLALIQGLTAGAFALFATHAFSPYLNHPLGIGYLLFFALVVEVITDDGTEILEAEELTISAIF